MNLVNVKPGFARKSPIDQIFEDFFQNNPTTNVNRPAANIIDQEKAFVLELAIPGITKEALNISVEKNVLTIKSDTKETSLEEGRYTRKEFGIRNFERKFQLKEKVLTDAIEAKLENGILRLHIPKAAEVYTKQLIEIA
jgi:HSP20 family protein